MLSTTCFNKMLSDRAVAIVPKGYPTLLLLSDRENLVEMSVMDRLMADSKGTEAHCFQGIGLNDGSLVFSASKDRSVE